MDVTFATQGGREFTVEVWYFATVREMKEAVHAREGIPVASQRLFLAAGREAEDDRQQELEDARDTEHYGIVQGSRVVLVLPDDDDDAAPPPQPSPTPSPSPSAAAAAAAAAVRVAVSVSAPEIGGPPCSVDVPASDTVARLKDLLQDRTDGALPAARTALFLGKAEMEDGKTLADYYDPSADGGMDVTAVVRPPQQSPGGGGNGAGPRNQQRIEVRVMSGETAVALEVGVMDVVRDLRKEVDRLRLSVRDGGGGSGGGDGGYFFLYKQNVMDEDRTLRWHEVKNGDTIEILNGTVTGGA